MAKSCPYCMQVDIADKATRCQHCGSWLEPGHDDGEGDRLHREIREDLRSDLDAHRTLIEKMLSRLQNVAAVIIVAAAGAALFFGFRTDQSITDTSQRISDEASVRIEQATTDITKQASEEVRRAVNERLVSPEMNAMIDKAIHDTLGKTVETAVEQRFDRVSQEVEGQMERSREELDELLATIEALKQDSEAALREVEAIQTGFSQAQRQTVRTSRSVLPVEPVRVQADRVFVAEKGGLAELRALVEQRVNALSFHVGGGYYGPAIWKYFDVLRAVPEFRHVFVFGADQREIVALYDAATLADHFEPASRPPEDQLPPETAVPGWTRFAQWVTQGQIERLATLPSFQPGGEPVNSDWSSLQALDHMERLGAETLPVVDQNGAVLGIIGRSRLTTRVLLELAAQRN